MTWRTVVVTNRSKLSYKNGYLIYFSGDGETEVYLDEIGTLIVETTGVTITSYLLAELIKKKVKVIFCDQERNPISELVSYYGAHDTSKKINVQTTWNDYYKRLVWTEIIIQKIKNQSLLLKKLNFDNYQDISSYADTVEFFDPTNREGMAAKLYFSTLFGKTFKREEKNDINAMLDYGYTILLSTFNREIVKKGYITQIGLKHKNQFNYFNLSSDLMEPFRTLVDEVVYENKNQIFDSDMKGVLINMFEQQLEVGGKNFYLTEAIQKYVQGVLKCLEKNNLEELLLYQFS